jgi:hypothetical protein
MHLKRFLHYGINRATLGFFKYVNIFSLFFKNTPAYRDFFHGVNETFSRKRREKSAKLFVLVQNENDQGPISLNFFVRNY